MANERPAKRVKVEVVEVDMEIEEELPPTDDDLIADLAYYMTTGCHTDDHILLSRLMALLRSRSATISSDAYCGLVGVLVNHGRHDLVGEVFHALDGGIKNCLGLRLASKHGYYKHVDRFLSQPEVNPNEYEGAALILALQYGFTEIALRLLADPRTFPAFRNNAAFCWAAQLGLTPVVEVLLQDSRVDPSDREDFAIRQAAICNRVDVVELLLPLDAINPGAKCNYALRKAATRGHHRVISLLLADKRVNPNDTAPLDAPPALVGASMKGHLKAVDALLVHPDVDPNIDGGAALLSAVTQGKQPIVQRILIHPRAAANVRAGLAMRIALDMNHRGLVEDLLTRKDLRAVLQRCLVPRQVQLALEAQNNLVNRRVKPVVMKAVHLRLSLPLSLTVDVLAKIAAFAWGADVVVRREIGCGDYQDDPSIFPNAERIFKKIMTKVELAR